MQLGRASLRFGQRPLHRPLALGQQPSPSDSRSSAWRASAAPADQLLEVAAEAAFQVGKQLQPRLDRLKPLRLRLQPVELGTQLNTGLLEPNAGVPQLAGQLLELGLEALHVGHKLRRPGRHAESALAIIGVDQRGCAAQAGGQLIQVAEPLPFPLQRRPLAVCDRRRFDPCHQLLQFAAPAFGLARF